MNKRTDIINEGTFNLAIFSGLFLAFVPYYCPLMMLFTLSGASFIELVKYLVGYRPQYSVWWGIVTCTSLSYLMPFYVLRKIIDFLTTLDVKHLDLTGDICYRRDYYYPIAIDPLFVLGNVFLYWSLYIPFLQKNSIDILNFI